MQEVLKLVIGVVVLALGIPIGNYLAKLAREELKDGQKWFKPLIVLCMVGAVLSLIFRDDPLLFSFLFIAIVTSKGLKAKNK